MGLTWESAGLGGDYCCLARGQADKSCFLVAFRKPSMTCLTAELWLEPPKPRSTNVPISHSKCRPSLPEGAGQPNSSSNSLSVLLRLSACISMGILLLPNSWEEEESAATHLTAPLQPLHLLKSPPSTWGGTLGRHRSSPALPSLLLFLLSRCISASVGCSSVPARLITVCLPEFPCGIPAG